MARPSSQRLLTPVVYPALLDAIELKFGSVEKLHQSGNFTYSTATIKDYLAGNIELNVAQKEELAQTMETKVEIIDEELLKPPGGRAAYEAEHGQKFFLPDGWMDKIDVKELNRLRQTGREPVPDTEIARWAGVAPATAKSYLFGTSRQRSNTKEKVLSGINRHRPDLVLLTFENMDKDRQDKLAAKAAKAQPEATAEHIVESNRATVLSLSQLDALLMQLGVELEIVEIDLKLKKGELKLLGKVIKQTIQSE